MRDADIRTALHTHLTFEHASQPETKFVDELGVCGTVRVDVAVINGTLSGYELKSDHDTLRRLPTQVDLYSKVLDHASLVVGERYATAPRTLELIPDWWGVIVAASTVRGVELEQARTAQRNTHVDKAFLVQLLWRDEALDELTRHGADRGVRTKPRRVIADRLAEVLELGELRAVVRDRLKAREGWPRPAIRASGDASCQPAAMPPGSRRP